MSIARRSHPEWGPDAASTDRPLSQQLVLIKSRLMPRQMQSGLSTFSRYWRGLLLQEARRTSHAHYGYLLTEPQDGVVSLSHPSSWPQLTRPVMSTVNIVVWQACATINCQSVMGMSSPAINIIFKVAIHSTLSLTAVVVAPCVSAERNGINCWVR